MSTSDTPRAGARVHLAAPTDVTPAHAVQGQRLTRLITHASCGARQLSAGLVVMPPGAVSAPHLHAYTK